MLSMECIFIFFFYKYQKSYVRRSINPTTSKPHYWIKSTADSLHPHALLYNTGSCSLHFIEHIKPSQLYRLLINPPKWNKHVGFFFFAHEFTKLLMHGISISVFIFLGTGSNSNISIIIIIIIFKISSKLKFNSIFRMLNSSLTGHWPTSTRSIV